MKMRTACLLGATALPFSASACAVWGDTNLACEVTFTCESTQPSDAGRGSDVELETASEASRIVDSGAPDSSVDAAEVGPQNVADVGMDTAEIHVPADAPEAGCDAARGPHEDSCTIHEQYGVFVAPSAMEGTIDGSRAHPFTSLEQALRRAKAEHKRVYVCDDGTGYNGSISIGPTLDGLRIFGGFECAGWTYSTTRRARFTAVTSPVLTISGLTDGIVLQDVEVSAADAVGAGENSIGVVVYESAGVLLRQMKIASGKGKDGDRGENGGGSATDPSPAGVHGNNGAKACMARPNLGGFAVDTVCKGVATGTSGAGGTGALNATAGADNGGNGFPTYTGGKGGTGQPVLGSWDCAVGRGQDGSNGQDGSQGSNGTGIGTLSISGWAGPPGADGTPGQPGQGGGGGGGAKAPTDANACTPSDGGAPTVTGASGGSGGGGGCGGSAGKGGAPGGSSIALVSIGSQVTLETCELIASDAGKGGNGGQGQFGGNGGLPGIGGDGTGGSNPGCSGGNGGKGGNGGAGGGGAGGHSIGVAYRGKAPTGLESTAVKTGAKGAGGQPAGGSGKADDGVADVLRSFDLGDAGG